MVILLHSPRSSLNTLGNRDRIPDPYRLPCIFLPFVFCFPRCFPWIPSPQGSPPSPAKTFPCWSMRLSSAPPRRPPRHHRTELEGSDHLVSGECLRPIQSPARHLPAARSMSPSSPRLTSRCRMERQSNGAPRSRICK